MMISVTAGCCRRFENDLEDMMRVRKKEDENNFQGK